MENFIIELIQRTADQQILCYSILFAASVLENIFPPLPGDTVILVGALLAASGILNPFIVFSVTTTGSFLGYLLLFKISENLGREYFLRKNFRFFSKKLILMAEKRLKETGYLLVVFNRFLPGLRSVISIASGMLNLKPIPVALLSLLSAAMWNTIWIIAGMTLGTTITQIKERGGPIALTVIGGAVLIVAALSVYFIKFRKRK